MFHWYIVHAYSGSEKKVAASIREQAEKKGLTHLIDKVVVPVEGVQELRRGKKITVERNYFPGYVLVKMELNDDSWHLVKNVNRVTGFLGSSGKPQPISDGEAERIFKQMEDGVQARKSEISYEPGETVKIIEGPFESFVGTVEAVDDDKERLKVAVSIFGRSTPVELEFSQVEKEK